MRVYRRYYIVLNIKSVRHCRQCNTTALHALDINSRKYVIKLLSTFEVTNGTYKKLDGEACCSEIEYLGGAVDWDFPLYEKNQLPMSARACLGLELFSDVVVSMRFGARDERNGVRINNFYVCFFLK